MKKSPDPNTDHRIVSVVDISFEPELSSEDRAAVLDGLVAYNREQGFVWEHQPINVLARDEGGQIIGGLLGEINLRWLFVSALWVAPEKRGLDIGSALLREAEDRARERGCAGIYLDTFSFQARPFYERLGYELFGELTDCPPGEAKYYLHKRLSL